MHRIAQFFEKSDRRMVENRVHGVEPERIDVKLADPVKRVLNEKVSYLITPRSVEIERRHPTAFGSGR